MARAESPNRLFNLSAASLSTDQPVITESKRELKNSGLAYLAYKGFQEAINWNPLDWYFVEKDAPVDTVKEKLLWEGELECEGKINRKLIEVILLP